MKGIAPTTNPLSSESPSFPPVPEGSCAPRPARGVPWSAAAESPTVVTVAAGFASVVAGLECLGMSLAGSSDIFVEGEVEYSWKPGVVGRRPSVNDILRDSWSGRRAGRDVSLTEASSGGVGNAPVANAPDCPAAAAPAAIPRDLKEGSCRFCRAFTRCDSEPEPVGVEVDCLWPPHVHGNSDFVEVSLPATVMPSFPLLIRQLGTAESECAR